MEKDLKVKEWDPTRWYTLKELSIIKRVDMKILNDAVKEKKLMLKQMGRSIKCLGMEYELWAKTLQYGRNTKRLEKANSLLTNTARRKILI